MSERQGFPQDDQFEDTKVAKVRASSGGGWEVEQDTGWSLFIPAESPVTPVEGMTLRLYGCGIGFPFRGMFLDGKEVFYRTEAEQDQHQLAEAYGADAAAYVAKWDGEGHVWSIAMGGFGPGYEQALQIAMIEVLRHLVETKPDASAWDDRDSTAWRDQVDAMHEPMMPVLAPLGLSGAQWGAACSLAGRIYRDGPIATLKDADSDRKIQVGKHFPTLDPRILSALEAAE